MKPSTVVYPLKDNEIQKVELFGADPAALQALMGSGIEVMVGIPNEMLASLSSSTAASDLWVRQNVSRYVVKGGFDIRYVAVGNKPFLSSCSGQFQSHVLPALLNPQQSLARANLAGCVKLVVLSNADAYKSSLPSQGAFWPEPTQIMSQLVQFLNSNGSHPQHIVLITGGPLNRVVKIWASAEEEGWLLPSDFISWNCTQTLDLKSSAEPRLEDAFFNQVAALNRAGLFSEANAKKNAIYAVHIDYGANPASTCMDYIAEFTATMPILSLTRTNDGSTDGEHIVQVYCVQTEPIQQYVFKQPTHLVTPSEIISTVASSSENSQFGQRMNAGASSSNFVLSLSALPSCSSGVSSSKWVLDSGAAHHMCYDSESFRSFGIPSSAHIMAANGTLMSIRGIGSVQTDKFILFDVYYIPCLEVNLVSVSQLYDSGCLVYFNKHTCLVEDCQSQRPIGNGYRERGIYVLEELRLPTPEAASVFPPQVSSTPDFDSSITPTASLPRGYSQRENRTVSSGDTPPAPIVAQAPPEIFDSASRYPQRTRKSTRQQDFDYSCCSTSSSSFSASIHCLSEPVSYEETKSDVSVESYKTRLVAEGVSQKVHDLSETFSSPSPPLGYPMAGPCKKIFYDPKTTQAAVVTCGGLCPGMNTVIKELVVGLWELYGVRQIYGIQGGYRGFYSREPVELSPRMVHGWHKRGGTELETSGGGFDLNKIVDAIQHHGFNQLYIIGGDGTMRGAVEIFNEIQLRKLHVGVVGIPKTVDNDVGIIDRSFGFQTAVERAQQAISAAHVEAESAVNGIGLVKLMGRSTGHIALHATLSSRDVDCCLIPETEFYLEGKGGLFEFLENRLKENGHAVVVVAEGAGQDMIPRTDAQKEERDESGNLVFLDVGSWMKSELQKWWDRDHPDELFTVKYIDPTYMIRAVPANASDNLYCTLLAHSSIHGVMAGFTGFVCGPIDGNYAYIPLEEVAQAKHEVDTKDHKGAWVRSVTYQPDFRKS